MAKAIGGLLKVVQGVGAMLNGLAPAGRVRRTTTRAASAADMGEEDCCRERLMCDNGAALEVAELGMRLNSVTGHKAAAG